MWAWVIIRSWPAQGDDGLDQALRVQSAPAGAQPGWYWVVAGLFLLCYLLITVAFQRPVESCLNELTNRPATTFLLGLLTKLLVRSSL